MFIKGLSVKNDSFRVLAFSHIFHYIAVRPGLFKGNFIDSNHWIVSGMPATQLEISPQTFTHRPIGGIWKDRICMKLGDFSGPKRNQQKYQLPNFFYDAYVVLCCFFLGKVGFEKLRHTSCFKWKLLNPEHDQRFCNMGRSSEWTSIRSNAATR